MKTAFAIVTLSLLLSACASRLPRPAAPEAETQAKVQAEVVADTSDDDKEAAGPSALSREVLFQILSADIAFQRGEWQAAYATMMSVARQTRDPQVARRAVEMAMTVKQPAEALEAVRLWRELAPQSEEATQYFLGFIILSDNIAEAEPILSQRLAEISPQSRAVLMFQIQRVVAGAKNKAAAFAMLERVLQPYLASAEAHITLAQGAAVNGDSERAVAEARAALEIKPDSELAVLMLAQVTADPAASTAILADFLKSHPNSREVRIAYARLLTEQKQYAKARGEFEWLLNKHPHDATSLYALGVLATQANDSANAEKYFVRYLDELGNSQEDERDTGPVMLLLAQIAEERGDIAGALGWLDKIEPSERKSSTTYFSAQIKRAQLIAKRGDLQGANRLLAQLPADSAREQAQVVQAQAQLLLDARKEQEAHTVLRNAVKRFPENTELLYDYAMTAEKLGKYDLMETTLRKVISLEPSKQHAYNALGYSLAERNIRLGEAYVLVDKALSLAPDDPYIIDSMGWVQFRIGKLQEAEDFLRKAYSMRPDVEIAAHLGEVLWARGQRQDAQKLWREARNKDPKNTTLNNTLNRLNVKF